MTTLLRLLADDLTGALDTAAEFAALCGPVPVPLRDPGPTTGSLALDSGTREAGRAEAAARVAALAPALAAAGIAYKKVDSLLRGNVAAELAACLATGPWRHCIVAPAFPAMGRITRQGQQLMRDGGAIPGGDILALLDAEGLTARLGSPLAEGITVFDAETDTDLATIAALGGAAPGPLLWCGTGGLARALAAAAPSLPDPRLEAPVLGLFGSDQPVTAAQLAACGPAWVRLDEPDAAPVTRSLDRHGAALVSLDLPPLSRPDAAARIAVGFAALLPRLPRPGTLLVAGGETLRAVCQALGTESLLATGLVEPGVPRSILQGGTWDGLTLVSKSGAFGDAMLWRRILAYNDLPLGSDA